MMLHFFLLCAFVVAVTITRALEVDKKNLLMWRLEMTNVSSLVEHGWSLERSASTLCDKSNGLISVSLAVQPGADRSGILRRLFDVVAEDDEADDDNVSLFRFLCVRDEYVVVETPRDPASTALAQLATDTSVAVADVFVLVTVGGFAQHTQQQLLSAFTAAQRLNRKPMVIVIHQLGARRLAERTVVAIARAAESALRSRVSHVTVLGNYVRYTLAGETSGSSVLDSELGAGAHAAALDVWHFVFESTDIVTANDKAAANTIRSMLRMAARRSSASLAMPVFLEALGAALRKSGNLWHECGQIKWPSTVLLVEKRERVVLADNVCLDRRLSTDAVDFERERSVFAPRVVRTIQCRDGDDAAAVVFLVSAVGARSVADFAVEVLMGGASGYYHVRVTRHVDRNVLERGQCSAGTRSVARSSSVTSLVSLLPLTMRHPDMKGIELSLNDGMLQVIVRDQLREAGADFVVPSDAADAQGAPAPNVDCEHAVVGCEPAVQQRLRTGTMTSLSILLEIVVIGIGTIFMVVALKLRYWNK